MEYAVRFVRDELMPRGMRQVVCRLDGETYLAIAETMLGDAATVREKEQMLEAAWAGYRRMQLPSERYAELLEESRQNGRDVSPEQVALLDELRRAEAELAGDTESSEEGAVSAE